MSIGEVEAVAPVVRSGSSAYFSPNGDGAKDKVRIPYTLAKKSVVTVKVRRINGAKSVLTQDLGKVRRGAHQWKWNGKNAKGRIVRDGQYRVVFLADPTQRGKKDRARADVFVDTAFEPAGVQTNTSASVVYPQTTVINDRIGFRHGCYGCTDDEVVTQYVFRVVKVHDDGSESVVYTSAGDYPPHRYFPITWDGRDNNGQALPAGRYVARLEATDLAGNSGIDGWTFVDVSGAPLVEATGTMTVAPVIKTSATARALEARADDSRSSTTGGDDPPPPVPCGAVVPSTVYPAFAASYRSSDACGGTAYRPSMATASGAVDLLPVNAPRGMSSLEVAMRGKPTFDGETDTAELVVNMSGGETVHVTSNPAVGETVTTGSTKGWDWDPTQEMIRPGVGWTITTRGNDSYDVAAVTVTYKYLTPQP